MAKVAVVWRAEVDKAPLPQAEVFTNWVAERLAAQDISALLTYRLPSMEQNLTQPKSTSCHFSLPWGQQVARRHCAIALALLMAASPWMLTSGAIRNGWCIESGHTRQILT
jgi:hypothetical protein